MGECLGTAFLPSSSPSHGPDKEGVTDLPGWGINQQQET